VGVLRPVDLRPCSLTSVELVGLWPDLSTSISTGKEPGLVLGKRAERGRWPAWEGVTISRRPSFGVEQRVLPKSPLRSPCSIAANWPLDG